MLVVDLRSRCDGVEAAAIEHARHSLECLPCPSLALGDASAGPVAAALVASFDIVADREADLAAVQAAIRATPFAATALVQLLRLSEAASIHEALIAESLVYSMLQAGPEFAAWLAKRELSGSRSRPPDPAPAVLAERSGERLALTLNRPDKHNAFSAEMRDALCEGLQIALGDGSIRAVCLRGAGASFSSGGDLDEFGTLTDPVTAHMIRSTRNAGRMLSRCSERVTCFVHGACVGAGAELPAFAGHVVASPDAYFQLPEASMGLVPGAGGTASIPRRIGRQRTAALALSGRRIDAETALRFGLVDELGTRQDLRS
jgi:enoyl-CoA hydratase